MTGLSRLLMGWRHPDSWLQVHGSEFSACRAPAAIPIMGSKETFQLHLSPVLLPDDDSRVNERLITRWAVPRLDYPRSWSCWRLNRTTGVPENYHGRSSSAMTAGGLPSLVCSLWRKNADDLEAEIANRSTRWVLCVGTNRPFLPAIYGKPSSNDSKLPPMTPIHRGRILSSTCVNHAR